MADDQQGVFVHQDGRCESTTVGPRTRVWAFAHVLAGAVVGSDCNIGDGAYVEAGAVVGNRVTVKNQAMVFEGVTIEDDVFLGPGVIFTNDLNPRAFIKKHGEELLPTLVRRGATLGAGSIIVCGTTIGEYAFIGAGTVVARDVPPQGFVVGNPGRLIGWACTCGARIREGAPCVCGRSWTVTDRGVAEVGV